MKHRWLALICLLGLPLTAQAWTMTAVGDIMLDRHVRTLQAQRGQYYPFNRIGAVLSGGMIVGNLEGPITTNQSVASFDRLIFTFDPAVAQTLSRVGFTHLSLANNHALNFGGRGLDQTRSALWSATITPVGDPTNRHGFGTVQEVNGRRIALIGFHAFSSGLETILADIREAEGLADVTVVFPHWGSEYKTGIHSKVQSLARQLVDAGADVVIGAHPHVVQPIEVYREKFIAYSLGNFIFDQYWSSDVQSGLLIRLQFGINSMEIELVPLTLVWAQPRISPPRERTALLNRIARDSIVSEAQRSQIQSGILRLP